ncbi:ImmA/IrrE family metallo-endopeptidase [Streptomyces rubiginosohelvolus]|uniref:ImmA/IrrE family metallo-endopeptidase n=1 Tax=Streptomyces rubiginosohelvolus TaxID=67362 RepID=UPI00365D724D
MKAESPEKRLAATLVQRLGLTPPVDIFSVASRYADVEECEWPSSCDGVALELNSSRPRIFLKKIKNRRRMRFTLAHELAHVLLPWHVETIHCDTQKSSADDAEQSERANAIGVAQEHQANIFASHLLVPRSFLSAIAPGYVKADEVLAGLEQADVSASAGAMALASYLPAGYVFLVRGMNRMIRSPGTEVTFPLVGPLWEQFESLKEQSVRSGSITHQDQQLDWFELFDSIPSAPVPIDERRSTEILADVLTLTSPESDIPSRVQSIMAKVGGVLSQRKDLSDVEDIHTLLVYKFQADQRYADLLEVPEFRIYLRKRSAEISDSRTGVKSARRK